MSLKLLAVAALFLVGGCGRAAADLEDICNAEERTDAAHAPNPEVRIVRISKWIRTRLRTSQGRQAFDTLSGASCDRGHQLELAAKQAGFNGPCPLAHSNVLWCPNVEDFADICNAEESAGAAREADPESKHARIRDWLLLRQKYGIMR